MCQSQSKERIEKGGVRMKDTTIAVGLAKNVFEIAISREAGKVSKQLRVSRPKLVSFFAKQSAATVLLEACGSAHFWARTLRRLGHDVVLLPTHLVRSLSTREQERPRGHQSFARGLPERGDSFGAHQVRAPAHPRLLFFILNREDFSFVIQERPPRTMQKYGSAQTASRVRSLRELAYANP